MTHSATPRRKTTETGWHTPPLSDFGDTVPAVDSQEADEDSLNVVQRQGLGDTGQRQREPLKPNPQKQVVLATQSGPCGPSLLSFF